jgi:DNA-binding NarL/FixJ family response regulator
MSGRALYRIAGMTLIDRQRDIWHGIASSKTTKQIADEMNLSTKAVEYHRLNLYNKLQMWDTAALTRAAVKHGLIII